MMTAQTKQTAPGFDLDAALKRGGDIVLTLPILIVLAPVLLLIALIVATTSPGGALFRQQRVGRGGKLFWLLKFRSMRINSSGTAVTSGNDTRITSVGKWLRKWKLDELPQFWNVLKGEMSLVGPRPEVPHYVVFYSQEQRAVLSVRPGITGAAQLEYRDEETLLAGQDDVETFYITQILPTKLAIDLRYLRERSFGGDLRLMLKTMWAILS